MHKLTDTISQKVWNTPNYRAKDIADIDFKALHKAGITKVAIDIDGTLLPGGTFGEIIGRFTDHLSDARKAGHISRLVIATNRLSLLARKVGVSIKADAVVTGSLRVRKPSRLYYKHLLAELGGSADEAIMIGDKLFQDIYGANRMGMHSLLVDDYGPEPFYERIVMHRRRQHKRLREIEKELKNIS